MPDSLPINRLSTESINNLKFVVQKNVPADSKQEYESHFRSDLLPSWQVIEKSIQRGLLSLHELRSNDSGLLLTAKILVNYYSAVRGDRAFALSAWAVTPDSKDGNLEQGKGKGYGSFLMEKSIAVMKRQNPHIFAMLIEQEDSEDEILAKKHAKRKVQNGLRPVLNLNYEIPPFPPQVAASEANIDDAYVEVAKRPSSPKSAQLLIRRFDGLGTIEAKDLISIVQRLYSWGYGVSSDDAFLVSKINEMSKTKTFELG